jgi:hypothetical protein
MTQPAAREKNDIRGRRKSKKKKTENTESREDQQQHMKENNHKLRKGKGRV